jgi:hypothetical protein
VDDAVAGQRLKEADQRDVDAVPVELLAAQGQFFEQRRRNAFGQRRVGASQPLADAGQVIGLVVELEGHN